MNCAYTFWADNRELIEKLVQYHAEKGIVPTSESVKEYMDSKEGGYMGAVTESEN